MTSKEKNNLESLALKLLSQKFEINVRDVAEVAGLHQLNETNRKAIRRALQALVSAGILQAEGTTRARRYSLRKTPVFSTYKTVPISASSQRLLKYLEQPIRLRTPVGYNQELLRAYKPNKTEYLSQPDRVSLLEMGRSENTERPAGTYARNILNRLLIDLSWNSSRLEGNTYSLLETKRLIELGESTEGKDSAETQMIINHKRAIEYIIDSCDEPKITTRAVYSVHTLLSFNLLGDGTGCGRIRQNSVRVTGTTYLPLENPHVIKEYFELFLEKLNSIDNPFEQSIFSMVHISYLQAFQDVNKRTGRLIANIPLIKRNLRPLSFTDVDQEIYVQSLLGIYEKNDISLFKDLYLWAYRRSSQKYSAVQQTMDESNLLKLKYYHEIQNIIRAIILEKTSKKNLVPRIRQLIDKLLFSKAISQELFKIVEVEISSLHDGNIAGYQISPIEFENWKVMSV
ncbi:MAG: Fic family protein [Myxococcaceae bacterium]